MDLILQNINLILILIIFGCLSGFLAGLLGAGGGMIIVPALFYAFKILGYSPDALMHLAVGTSLAIIFPTSLISSYTHYKLGNVDLNLLKYSGIFLAIGIIFGAIFTSNINTQKLLIIFSFFAFVSSMIFLFQKKEDDNKKKEIPRMLKFVYGFITGFISIPIGIGGASVMVPIMKIYNYSIKVAIGTTAHLGIIISFLGLISMMIGGKYIAEIDEPHSIGFVNLIGFFVFVPVTTVMASIGAKLVYKIKKEYLNKTFGIILLIISIRSIYESLNFS
tara:strand:- start:10 stop:840 length:831 start_codon:yes stop_codon:yes gene_type:complete